MTMESSGGNDVVEIDVVNVGEIDGKLLSPPVHMQAAMKHLQLHPLLHYIQNLLKDGGPKRSKIAPASMMPSNNKSSQTFGGLSQGVKIVSGVPITRAERIADRGRLYNFSRVRKKRKWMKNLLVDDSSDDEEKDRDQRIQSLLKHHKYRRACARDFRQGKHDRHFMYYSSSLLSNVDQHKERLESELATRVKTESSQQTESQGSEEDVEENDDYSDWLRHRRRRKRRRLSPEQAQVEQKNIWSSICKDFIPSAYKTRTENRRENMVKLKRVSSHCMRECRRVGLQSQKLTKESMARARKLAREAGNYWRKKDRNEKETKRKTDKEADEHRKQEMAVTEAQRQKRKLDFLITQTELYAHFMAGKITGQGDEYQAKILEQLPTDGGGNGKEHGSGDSSPFDSRSLALANAQEAFNLHASKRRAFSTTVSVAATTTTTATAETSRAVERQQQRQQPSMFNGILKAYQLDGMNWLVRLYEEGLNGILADEMGLGKTIQSLAFLAHLAETCNIWGPFLVVAPASTLHNWQQECARFLPKFKCVPYWGNAQDRKVLRKFWETSGISTEEGSFHVVITSYQIVVQDVRYFQKIDWHYLILDEAQAIKSSSSARWKILLGFTCRNRLLLTGTPIQNNMAELWSLLHFIMPTLFDCHEEFNEWFSKDIESHAENRKLHYDRNQLSRLRLILSPFMLRREKKEVENQLSEKIEIIVRCPLTSRQKILYEALKNKISIDDLLSSSRVPAQATVQTNTLMNLVMQFRKVCNHPDLIDRRQTYCGSKMEPEQFVVPRLLYPLLNPSFDHVLYNRLYIHHPANIAESLREHREGSSDESGFSFSRFVELSPGEVYRIYSSLMLRWLAVLQYWELAETVYLSDEWEGSRSRNSSRMMLLDCQRITSPPSVMASVLLSTLIFTSTLMTSYGHVDHTVKSMSETSGHRRIRLRERRNVSEKRHRSHKSSAPVSPSRSPARVVSPSRSAPVSPTKSRSKSTAPSTSTELVSKDESLLVHPHKERPDRVLPSLLTDWPKFTYLGRKKVHFPPRSWYCADRSADSQRRLMNGCGSLDAMRTLLYGSSDLYEDYERRNERFIYRSTGGLLAAKPWHGYSSVIVPEKESVVTDAGKLRVLDQLLTRLKSEGHRVLIYSQMTRMIDILEQYMWIRKHTYMRLDGSSKISERRDMIADFQSREDIFVFLLSTRAGGLGINLTAADTVIFYDSDWNPAVDKQAMDRAHRLGQTRQVTVYRLVTENSIEQRILERAEAKSQIQNMVMKGSSAVAPDALKPTEVVNLLLDDAELRSKFKEKNDDVAKGGRLANDGRESVQSSGTTSPGSSSVLSEQASSVLAHNDSSSDDAALFIAEEAGGNNDRSPKRRGRPGRSATPKRTSQGKAVVKQQQMPGGSSSSTGVEMVDGGSGSRAASLRTRSTNQTPGPHPPANE